MRLHKESRFDENEVIIKRVGPVPRLFPSHYRADDLFTLLDEIGPLEIERILRRSHGVTSIWTEAHLPFRHQHLHFPAQPARR